VLGFTYSGVYGYVLICYLLRFTLLFTKIHSTKPYTLLHKPCTLNPNPKPQVSPASFKVGYGSSSTDYDAAGFPYVVDALNPKREREINLTAERRPRLPYHVGSDPSLERERGSVWP